MPDLNINATQEVIMIIGQEGGDGGYWIITPNGLKKVPDNNPELREAYKTIAKNYAIIKKATLNQKAVRGL